MPQKLPLILLVVVLAGAAFWLTFTAPFFERRPPSEEEIEQMRATVRKADVRKALRETPDPVSSDARTTPPPQIRTAPAKRAPGPSTFERWVQDLSDDSHEVVFVATVELGKLGDKRAVPKLLSTLRDHTDLFVRLGAATALGDLGMLDAVPGLIEAGADPDKLVRQAVQTSLAKLTAHRFGDPTSSDRHEARATQAQWRDWWRDHEVALRRAKK